MSTEPEVVRWYTRARRFPQLIGRTPDGARIPGGPYTITQVLTAAGILAVGLKTLPLWARYGLIGNGLILAAVTYGAVLAVGRIPVGARSPLSFAIGAAQAVCAPRTGKVAGRAVRLRRPHRLRHQAVLLVQSPALPTPTTLAAHTAPARADSAPQPDRRPARRLDRQTPVPTAVSVHKPTDDSVAAAWLHSQTSLQVRMPPPFEHHAVTPAAGAPAPQPVSRAAAITRGPALSGVQLLLARTTSTRPSAPTGIAAGIDTDTVNGR